MLKKKELMALISMHSKTVFEKRGTNAFSGKNWENLIVGLHYKKKSLSF